jgi:minor extracellular serine protease Vpr
MRKPISFILLFFLFIPTGTTHTQSQQTLKHPPIPAESPNTEKIAIVMLDKPQSPDEILAKHPELELRYVFEHALNGFSVKGPAKALQQLAQKENILNISPVSTYQTEAIPSLIQSSTLNSIQSPSPSPNSDPNPTQIPSPNSENLKIIEKDKIWRLFDSKDQRLTGKGVTVGVIDTGIDYTHPDLKFNYKGGHDLVDKDHDPMETKSTAGLATLHGTHVAGIIAANGKIKGVAPEANLIAYRALGPGGSGTTEQVIAAIEQAIKDKVDILNLSLGNNVNGPDLPISVALNTAVEKGITAVTSSGNSGPNLWTVGSPGTASKAISVGASTPLMEIPYLQTETNQKIRLTPMQGGAEWAITRPTELTFAGLGQMKDLKNASGKIVLVERGKLTFTQKAKNAVKAGAKAIIIYNNTKGSFLGNLEETISIPVAGISKTDGKKLKQEQPKNVRTILIEEKDILADFSSRGPVTVTWEIKPDLVAPGVSINSTIPGGYLALQGTSMAAPHVAGAAALIKQAHPDWGPEEIKASLMNTAKSIADPNGNPYKTYEQGAGRIQPEKAINTQTLIMPGSLQFGKFQLSDKMHVHNAFVKIKNVSAIKRSYSFDIPKNEPGIKWELPLPFTLQPDETKEVQIKMSVDPLLFSKKIYDGYLSINEGSNKTRIPYLYALEEPDYPRVMGFEFGFGDKEKTYRYEVYLPGGAEEFGIALFHPGNYRFIGYLDWSRNVSKGMIQKVVNEENIPVEGIYIAKVFAKKGGKEDMIEAMIEILPREGGFGIK